MRKAVFLFFLLLGVSGGLLSTVNEHWGLKLMMMGVGALFGGAIGAGLSAIGSARPQSRLLTEDENIHGTCRPIFCMVGRADHLGNVGSTTGD